MTGHITIVLVQEQSLLLDALRERLDSEVDMSVIGTATDGADAVSVAIREEPDVVLLNSDTVGADAAVTVRGIRAALPACRIVVVSADELPWFVFDLVRFGISGYVTKRAAYHELKATILAALSDPDRVTVSLSRESFTRFSDDRRNRLSPREIEILVMVGRAMTNAKIAMQLGLTEATVKRHLRNIFGKLGAVSRIDAVNKAADSSLLPPGHSSRAGDGRHA